MVAANRRSKRRGQFVLGLGVALLTFAVLWALVFFPRQLTMPLDVDTQVSGAGTGTVLDFASLAEDRMRVDNDVPLRYTRYVSSIEPGDSEKLTAQIGTTITRTDLAERTERAAEGDGPEPALVAATVQRTTLNRDTAMPVDDLGNTTIQTNADMPSEPVYAAGLTIAWPRDAQREAYPYFDPIARRTAPMEFVDDAVVGDLPVYRYKQTMQDVDLADVDPNNNFSVPASSLPPDAPEELRDTEGNVTLRVFYSVERTIDVEPRTGRIVAAQEKVDQYLGSRPGEHAVPVLNFDIALDEASVQTLSDAARTELSDISRRGTWLPWTVGILGAILVFGGGIVILRNTRPARVR